MNVLTIIAVVMWLWTLLGHGSYRTALPLSYRVQNICLSLILVFLSSISIYGFWWRVFHPRFLHDSFMHASIFPPAISFIIAFLSVCAAHLELAIGVWMAEQRRRARTLVIASTPYLLGIEILNLIRVASEHRLRVAELGLAFLLPLTIGLFVWLYYFCKSKQSEGLMTNFP